MYTLEEILEHRKAWIADLRSGKKQTKIQLMRTALDGTKGQCCLGVACDTYKTLTGKGEWKEDSFLLTTPGQIILPVIQRLESTLEQSEIADYFGLTASDEDDLMHLNDTEDKTFDEIANYIEDEPVIWPKN